VAFEPVLRAEATLGECPKWSARDAALYWVDILGRRLHRFDPATGRDEAVEFDEEIGCFAERAGGGFVAGMRSGLWLLDAEGRKERMAASPAVDPKKARFNDGRADPWGGFWAGTMWEGQDRPGGALYRLLPGGEVATIEPAVTISNGVAFSPDRRWAYHSDTAAGAVWRYPLDPDDGSVTGPRQVFRDFGSERPDGAAVDEEGCYWSALFGAAWSGCRRRARRWRRCRCRSRSRRCRALAGRIGARSTSPPRGRACPPRRCGEARSRAACSRWRWTCPDCPSRCSPADGEAIRFGGRPG
jgi:sugar lactone lactonase YvrE